MTRTALTLLSGALLLVISPALLAQIAPEKQALEAEAVRRQENTIVLRQLLTEARQFHKKGELGNAMRVYGEALSLAQQIGEAGIEKERKETIDGYAAAFLEQAKRSYSQGNYAAAKNEVGQVLKVSPKNAAAQDLSKKVEKALAEQKGRIPSDEAAAYVLETEKERVAIGTLVQDGKLFYEIGKLQEAEAKLKEAVRRDPNNQGAFYYLRLLKRPVTPKMGASASSWPRTRWLRSRVPGIRRSRRANSRPPIPSRAPIRSTPARGARPSMAKWTKSASGVSRDRAM